MSDRERSNGKGKGFILFLTMNNWKTREGEFERHKWWLDAKCPLTYQKDSGL